MNDANEWQARIDALWARAETMPDSALVAGIDALADERLARDKGDAAALFEKACVRDTTGLEADAEVFYRAALAKPDLDDYRRSRASIQLGSTLRILGRLDESEALLRAEIDRPSKPGHPKALHDEVRALLALTWLAQGRASEAAGLALHTLAPHLTRYRRSVSGNATEWLPPGWIRTASAD